MSVFSLGKTPPSGIGRRPSGDQDSCLRVTGKSVIHLVIWSVPKPIGAAVAASICSALCNPQVMLWSSGRWRGSYWNVLETGLQAAAPSFESEPDACLSSKRDYASTHKHSLGRTINGRLAAALVDSVRGDRLSALDAICRK